MFSSRRSKGLPQKTRKLFPKRSDYVLHRNQWSRPPDGKRVVSLNTKAQSLSRSDSRLPEEQIVVSQKSRGSSPRRAEGRLPEDQIDVYWKTRKSSTRGPVAVSLNTKELSSKKKIRKTSTRRPFTRRQEGRFLEDQKLVSQKIRSQFPRRPEARTQEITGSSPRGPEDRLVSTGSYPRRLEGLLQGYHRVVSKKKRGLFLDNRASSLRRSENRLIQEQWVSPERPEGYFIGDQMIFYKEIKGQSPRRPEGHFLKHQSVFTKQI